MIEFAAHEPRIRMINLGILASHEGTNFQAIIDACARGELAARPVVAISNNSEAPVLKRACRAGVATAHLSSANHPNPDDLDIAIVETLQRFSVDLVITAGYMKKLGPRVLAEYRHCIVNIHPSLLPRHGGKGMYGLSVHRAVIASGDKETGITVHYVDDEYDAGPIIAQKRVAVLPDDTPSSLAARVLEQEHSFLIESLATLISKQSA